MLIAIDIASSIPAMYLYCQHKIVGLYLGKKNKTLTEVLASSLAWKFSAKPVTEKHIY